MSSQQLRFQIVRGEDNRWTVVDTESAAVACFGAEDLQGLTELQAQTFAAILNEIHPPRPTFSAAGAPEAPVRLN